ncbi:MAG: helix-turn-helix transcriptional regulator [Deltaproteobacteria bacterium]|nr:helix-turn-helix transcriptional regulator [Deltaproteobacteria bacterium]
MIRIKKGYVQEYVENYGVNVKQYQRIERGLVNVTAHTLYRLSCAFRCSINQFFPKPDNNH